MGLHSDIDSMDIRYRQLTRDALDEANKLKTGLHIAALETLREYLVQVAYVMRNRMPESDVDFAYAQAGLSKPDSATARLRCTDTLRSNHLSGRAIDCKAWHDDGGPVTLGEWKLIAGCFTRRGATWGKDWDRDGLTLEDGDKDESKWIQDVPHMEWPE